MELLEKVKSAQDNSERRKLAHEVVKLFLHSNGRATNEQVGVFGEVLCRLLSEMAQSVQVELANQVCDSCGSPLDLVKALAFADDVEVAEPVLQRSKQLEDADLIEVANKASTEHRLAISKREHLTASITDNLIKFEEGVVMQSVAENGTAAISSDGFSTLARNSETDERIMRALVTREDLPEETAQHILDHVDEDGKAILDQLVRSDSTLLHRLIKKSKRLTEEGKTDDDPDRIETVALIQQIEGGHRSLEQAIRLLAEQSRLKSIATMMAWAANLPEDEVNKGIVNLKGDFLALIAGALELSFDVYSLIDRLRTSQLRIPSNDPNKIFDQYDQLDPDHARVTLRMVNVIVKVG